MKSLSALGCSLLLLGCVTPNVPTASALTVDEVVAAADHFSGRDVTVRGFLSFGTDARNLWHSKEALQFVERAYLDPSHPAWARCISIDNGAADRATLMRLSGRNVSVSGQITTRSLAANEIRIGTCSDIFLTVREVRG